MFDYEKKECFECSCNENKLDDAKYWLNQVVECLYSTDELDENEFDRFIQELCGVLNLRIPKIDLSIQRKSSNIIPFDSQINTNKKREKQNILGEWLTFNDAYLKQIRNLL